MEWVLQEADMQSSDPTTACTEKVCEVQHTAHTHTHTHTLHPHCPWYCHNSRNITQRQARHIEHKFDNFKECTVCSSSSAHISTVMRKRGDLSESHFHFWIKTPLSCITTSLVMIHGASFIIPRPSLRWLGENHHHTYGKLNVYRKVMLETFFDSRNIIHKEFIPVAVTITEEWYVQELWDAIHQMQLDMWLLIPGCHCILVW
jgi:hypothetical protein